MIIIRWNELKNNDCNCDLIQKIQIPKVQNKYIVVGVNN